MGFATRGALLESGHPLPNSLRAKEILNIRIEKSLPVVPTNDLGCVYENSLV